ncbi:undecaprenyldiphospho-muramoylpentapeptide beta-N-acetylglucosaminyltransferase [Natranaerobius thermophilus]|uniref:UDP-N-acetylglucosamine--N-acetylmuramyl-(pentapeptide) pyrophosphoryl-undecaprenol N-acetylglucosamine transferase n=1 Tax=Natranaerobius thermophilus (strain ATCC BAA-1301 / DSM 18059 / JW/NM-WN-LF) TaxID=457570 RepID=MURG_NATTJ|nr:undecaprenyldiphospho-muramoylpentapeptide beta-N-acetylglucosaminyltransferase [Natranaerobius thermophilus]B2A2H2.1 RecName: Full=UDP-N-acetylglucosamine--N-acetylmuramyl-(pentapeptide) pyrophosphoryl-undecaprenol N-acetylglucosamine transferase; AltName: Full=Undecaprenyl-PP-MurNAc-pentapeptide-UDPGlcNAc GlcNAc transferase [Natranaerobius thermophilus JW/NM-WN-LF]ACB84887.1 UDP-N-acetylglucosamine--N-acetylmuramyl-(pentapeptide) pyrophosphoryl-undecaprenol N-acetylglucosamine transferase [N
MKVLVTGGGTGGHIYPALAVINELKERNQIVDILYVGTSKGMEQEIIPNRGIDFAAITVRGLQRKINLEQVYFLRDFLKGLYQSYRLIKNFTPDVVIGTGGYVCGPVLMAASLMKIPTVLHEQNVIPGITNKFLSRFADYTCVSFPESKNYMTKAKKIITTGNPRAQEITSRDFSSVNKHLNLRSDLKTLLIVSGSRGAQKINETMINIIPELISKFPIQIIYVTGNNYYESIRSQILEYVDNSYQDRLKLHAYLSDLPAAISCADLVISRAGATTLAELTAAETPSILIPSPNVTNDHQRVNAKILGERGAAKVLTEDSLNEQEVIKSISSIINDEEVLFDMQRATKEISYPTAATEICKILESLI